MLKDVAFFLSETFKQTVKLTGIIYLHRITDNRMGGAAVRNLVMFKKLCGQDAFRHIVLATTMWSKLKTSDDYDSGVDNERQLTTHEEWWGMMHQRGSQVFRHSGSKECALKIVARLVVSRQQNGPVTLDIQREMVIDNKSLEDTAAGKEVEKEILEARTRFKEEVIDLQQSYEEALKDRDQQLADQLLKQRQDMEMKISKADLEREKLKISLEQLAEEKTAEYNALLVRLKAEEERREEMVSTYTEELQRVETQRLEDAAEFRRSREQTDMKQQAAEKQVRDMIEESNRKEAERGIEEQERLALLRCEAEERFNAQQAEAQRREKELRASIALIQQQNAKKGSIAPIVAVLAGLATAGVGVVTVNPALIAAGVGITGAAGAS